MNCLIKKRYYVSYIAKNDGIFVESIVEMLIRKVFYIYELLTSIMFDRGLQFVIII